MSELRPDEWQWKRPANGLILGRTIQSYKGVAFVRRLAAEGGCPERVPGYACSFLSDWEYAPTTPALTAAAWPCTEPARPPYRIPAREVVPGMLYVHADGSGSTAITAAERRDGGVLLWWGPTGGWTEVDCEVTVQLPGPSPRELACTCRARGDFWKAAYHDTGCPVAPIPGRHGGMRLRLWPAPWRGVAWRYEGEGAWMSPHGENGYSACVWADELCADRTWEGGRSDMILQCFYLPPEPQPEHREPTPWAPHAGYYDEAVTHG